MTEPAFHGSRSGDVKVAVGSDDGFSIVELSMVILVLGVLSAIAIPMVTSVSFQAERARLEAAVADSAQIVSVGHASEHDAARIESDLTSFISTTAATSYSIAGIADRESFCVELAQSGVGTARSGPGCASPGWSDE